MLLHQTCSYLIQGNDGRSPHLWKPAHLWLIPIPVFLFDNIPHRQRNKNLSWTHAPCGHERGMHVVEGEHKACHILPLMKMLCNCNKVRYSYCKLCILHMVINRPSDRELCRLDWNNRSIVSPAKLKVLRNSGVTENRRRLAPQLSLLQIDFLKTVANKATLEWMLQLHQQIDPQLLGTMHKPILVL